ncbi:MAG: hypothetical protein GEU74_16735 [Nitriliruptorales bacterium]|nr:hypothetical protein [Nitriliruptorales bacterium]
MLIDTRPPPPAANPTATFRPTPEEGDTATLVHTDASVRELVNTAGLLVAQLGLCEGARWAEASAGVAATAATLRSAVIALSVATPPVRATEPIDAVPVAATAAPVVRAREIGFLASRLVAVLEVGEHDQIHATMTAVAIRLEEDLQVLRGALDVGASTPRRHRTARFLRRQ